MRWLSSRYQALCDMLQQFSMRLWAFVLARSPAQGLVEYSLILVLIMIVCVAILTAVGRSTSELWYQRIIDAMP